MRLTEPGAGSGATDSVGIPWAGRSFDHHPAGQHNSERGPEQSPVAEPAVTPDDGSADARLIDLLAGFRSGVVGEVQVVQMLRTVRLLVPLVAQLGESGLGEHGLVVDKSAELSLVTVSGPDGRSVMPVFSSVEAMKRWKPLARPVPTDAVRMAVAAVGEGTQLVVLDPTSVTEFAIRGPALRAIARSQPWLPSYLDGEILEQFRAVALTEPAVVSLVLAPGDAAARLTGPELVVQLNLLQGLSETELAGLLQRLGEGWRSDAVIAERVDSLTVRLVAAKI